MDNLNEKNLWLKIHRAFSPGEWKAGLLGLSKSRNSASAPGLVMIQIDGLSREELNNAFARNEMPCLKRLLTKENYKLYPHYPGLPSTTPSVQGELFYGVKQAVPAFFFFDRQTRKVFKMFDGDSVREIERRLAMQGRGLLEGGSSYSNIYAGGAVESHFCAVSLGWDKVWKDVNVFNFVLLFFTHFIMLTRMVVFSVRESILAMIDFIYGLIKREDPEVEFKFIFLRTFLCVLLRELITLGAVIDAARGLPIIHLNFIGYDEQAHRRGPASPTAHWALQGIDTAIARIYAAATNSSRRHYDVWVYSDHGQVATIPYVGKHKRGVEEAVAEVFQEMFSGNAGPVVAQPHKKHETWGIQFQRIRYFGTWIERFWPLNHPPSSGAEVPECVTAAMGPLGHVYLSRTLTVEETAAFAQALVRKAQIPLVLSLGPGEEVYAWNAEGKFCLPEEGERILGPHHPFFNEVMDDLVRLCRHPNAGTLVISGWQTPGTPYSFPFENGAHAGPGQGETDAFALLPADVLKLPPERAYVRTMDLRRAALRLLKRSDGDSSFQKSFTPAPARDSKTIRIMTYNVHSCIGTDGKISPQRIARVIGRYDPDIVALQELDLMRGRTGGLDQPHFIARELEMLHHFHPSFKIAEEEYGNAVLSRFPMHLKKAAALPALSWQSILEPRGVIWVDIEVNGQRLQFLTSHLSLVQQESLKQAKALLGPEWLDHPECQGAVVLCGDFNSLPSSDVCRRFKKRLHDAQEQLGGHRPKPTWSSRYPVGRIDHVFVSDRIEVTAVEVRNNHLEKKSSDHLPLVVDIRLRE